MLFFAKVATLLAVTIVSGAELLSLDLLANAEWEAFKTMYGKTYTTLVEELFRKNIFFQNRLNIAAHNIVVGTTYRLAMNSFGDISSDEFFRFRTGLKIPENITLVQAGVPSFVPPPDVTIPDSLDWTELGYVTPVKDQEQCASSWAFATTAALEGQIFKQTGKLVSLSEQNLIDCSKGYGNNGCDGGLPDFAFNYIRDNGGIDTEASYPYEDKDSTCRYSLENKGGNSNGYALVSSGDKEMLKIALASVGPVRRKGKLSIGTALSK